jgi:hypothetical protein
MTTGFTSKYKDAGYTLPDAVTIDGIKSSWYDQEQNNVNNTKWPSADIYTAQPFGVYMFDGSSSVGTLYPIVCSLQNMNVTGCGIDRDDGYVVYPGWGFQLYNSIGYLDKITNIYVNTGTVPIFFVCASDMYYNNLGLTKIYQSGDTIDNPAKTGTGNINSTTQLGANATNSIRIYFRGVEQKIPGLSVPPT